MKLKNFMPNADNPLVGLPVFWELAWAKERESSPGEKPKYATAAEPRRPDLDIFGKKKKSSDQPPPKM